MIEILNPPVIEHKNARRVSPLGMTKETQEQTEFEAYLEKLAIEKKKQKFAAKEIKAKRTAAKRKLSDIRKRVVNLRNKLKVAESDYLSAMDELKKI